MTLKRIEKTAAEIDELRAGILMREQVLQAQVRQFIYARDVSLRESAKAMGFSVAYLSDIIHGRRKISAAVIDAIRKLG